MLNQYYVIVFTSEITNNPTSGDIAQNGYRIEVTKNRVVQNNRPRNGYTATLTASQTDSYSGNSNYPSQAGSIITVKGANKNFLAGETYKFYIVNLDMV